MFSKNSCQTPKRNPARKLAAGAIVVFISLSAAAFLAGCNYETPARLYASPTVTASQNPAPADTSVPSLTQVPGETGNLVPVPTDFLAPSATSTITDTPTETSTNTPGPLPTSTLTPINTLIPTRTLVPSRTRSSTFTPTVTNTPTPPQPNLMFDKPGPLSKISSPIRMEVLVSPGDDGLITFSLTGEDGRLILEQVENYSNYLGRKLWISPKMEFSITAAAELARLSVFTRDYANRLISLQSVDVVLMMVGNDDVNPPVVTKEPFVVRYPEPAQVVSGGTLTLYSLIRPVNSSPLLVEVIDDSGKVVGSREFAVPQPAADLSHTPMVLEIPYTVEGPTSARVTLSQESDNRIPGIVALSSLMILLEP